MGGTVTIRVNVRVITATNRDLEALIESGHFRRDLYYRLNVFPIHMPSLRERRTDIPLLANYFIEKYSKAADKPVRRISAPALDMMMSYDWPGNVRELENCIERGVLLTQDEVIHAHHLPPTVRTVESGRPAEGETLQDALDRVERDLIVDSLKASRGNMARAARALALTERIMGLRVKKYGIEARSFRTHK